MGQATHPLPHRHEASGEITRFRERPAQGILVADGAIGTMLQGQGLQPGEPPELWNLTRPQTVQEIHEAYLAVGCDLVQTNTFGANPLRLKENGLAPQTAEINAAAVQLARRAGGAQHLVAGTVGPTGCFHKGAHTGSSQDIRSAFEEQISHLVHGGVDLVLIETMTHLDEAQMALQAAQTCAPVPTVVSLVFFEHGGRLRTLDGAGPQDAVRELRGAEAIGCNCMDVKCVIKALRQMREVTALPLVAQPHAGLPGKHEARVIYALTPTKMTRHLPALFALMPGVLGGCCGTTPAHLDTLIRSLRPSRP